MMRWVKLLLGISLFLPLWVAAEQPTVSSVEESIQAMDTDHDGMVTVFEMRSFLEARHDKGYKKQTLDNMEAVARGNSCSSPFAKPLY